MMPLRNILVHAGSLAKSPELFETAQEGLKMHFCCQNLIFCHLKSFNSGQEPEPIQCFESLDRKQGRREAML